MQTPADRIRLIHQSHRCFVLGLLSVLPLVGLVLAPLAIRLHLRAWSDAWAGWNPARRYWRAGYWLAWAGVAVSLIALALLGAVWLQMQMP